MLTNRLLIHRRYVFLLLLGFALLASSTVRAERLPIRIYNTADGLAHERVRRIVRDSRGFLWFCTINGLSRFDGYRFTSYRQEDGLPVSAVNDIVETGQGIYWIATDAGLSRFDPIPENSQAGIASHFKTYLIGADAAANKVGILYRDHAGRIWIGTEGGLFQLREVNGQISFQRIDLRLRVSGAPELWILSIAEDEHSDLWLGTSAGVIRFSANGNATNYHFQTNEPLGPARAVLPDRDGLIWCGLGLELLAFKPAAVASDTTAVQISASSIPAGDGTTLAAALSSLPPGRAVHVTVDVGIDNFVRALYQTVDGHLWISTGGAGAVEFDGRRLHRYNEAQGLVGNAINTFAEDSDNNLWFGSDTGGALKLTRDGFVGYFKDDGLGHSWIGSIFEQGADKFYVLSGEDVINQFDGQRFVNTSLALRRSSSGVFHGALQDHLGAWWIVTDQGLARFANIKQISELKSARPRIYTERDGLSSGALNHPFEDSRGDLWVVARANGAVALSRWSRANERWRRYTDADGVSSLKRIADFVEDRAAELWTIFDQTTLARFRNERFDSVALPNGTNSGQTRALHVDQSGRLWVVAQGELYLCEDPTAAHADFASVPLAAGLRLSDVTSMTSDLAGRLYFGTPRGIVRLNPKTGRANHYTIAEGLCNNEVSGAFRDRHGTLWFGTLDGLARFTPEPEAQRAPPSIFVGSLRVAGASLGVSELGTTAVANLKLNASQTQVQIDYFGLDFGAGETLRYQYTLEGADTGWSAPSEQRSVNYANLAPGSYRFQVRAVNADGIASPQPAFVSFRIAPPVWRSWWFLTLVVLLLAGSSYSLYNYRVRQLLALERVRTRIATDLHDDIGASLSRVAILSEVVRQQNRGQNAESEGRLAEIANSARELVDSMSDIVWSVDPRRDDLGNVVTRVRQFGADIFEAQGIQWELQVAVELEKTRLSPEQRRDLLLICKEALNNIARHAGCRRATLSLRVSAQQVLVEIKDDGRGFAAAAREDGREGHGLANMQARAARLGGSLGIVSDPGQGTQLNLSIPLHRNN